MSECFLFISEEVELELSVDFVYHLLLAFAGVGIQTGGYGVQWDENLSIPDSVLYKSGKKIPLTAEDFRAFASERVITAAEAAELLNCSRQYINELVKSDKLHPIKSSEKNTLFLKSEVLKRLWK